MKLKQLVITSTLLLTSSLVVGATYEVPNEEEFNVTDPFGHASTLNSESDNLLFDPKLSATQAKINQLKQDYIEILNLLKNKQLDSAENKLNLLIQENPNVSAFYNLQGLLESSKKESKLAINSFKKSIELAPNNLSSHLGIAAVYLSEGELKQAKHYTKRALAIDNTSTHAYILLAKIAYQEKNLQEVESILLTAQKKVKGASNQEIIVAGNLAKLYVIKDQPQKALSLAQSIIKLYPNDSSALALLANAQIFNNLTEQAIPTLEKLVKQEKNDTHHRLILAKLLSTHPQNQHRILKILNEVNSIAPHNLQVQVKRTVLLNQIKLFTEALQATKNIKRIAPDTGLAEALEGEIYLAEKKQDLALTAFKKSYSIKSNPKVLNRIVSLMTARGNQTEAINFLKLALNKNPKDLSAHFNLGNIYQQQNNNPGAEKHYQAILAEQPDNVIILNNLAWIYHQDNNPKALTLAERAYHKAPKSAAIADTYAVILDKQGDHKKALKIFQQAAKLAPDNYDIQYHLADAYAKSGRINLSIQILKTITQSGNDFSEKKAAESLLQKLT